MVAKRAARRKFGATQKDRIFLAVLPDAPAAARIHALAEELKAAGKFEGTLTRPEHLHVTLFHLGDWIALPDAIVEAVRNAAAEIDTPPFDVVCKRAESFRNSTGVYPFVLLAEQGATALRAFHGALGAALKRHGLGGATQGEFKPHVTLLRDTKRASPRDIEPLGWTVRDFVLVHSLLGQTKHVHIARWPLRA